MIRPKLILAFVAMALMTACCGAMGYLFVDRIGKSVFVFSDVTSPLLTESLALVDNAQRMRAAFLLALNKTQSADDVPRTIDALHATGQMHLGKLRKLASQPGVDLKLTEIAQGETGFFSLVESTLAARRRELAATAITEDRIDRFAAQRRAVEAMLVALVSATEGEINKREDLSKVDIQTGVATVDSLGNTLSGLLNQTFPILQYSSKLLAEIRQIDDTVGRQLPQADIGALDMLEQRTATAFRIIGSVTRKLAGRLRDEDGRAELNRIRQGFSALEAAVLGDSGLFRSQREMLAAQMEVATGRAALEQSEARYLGGLDEIVQAVSGVNQDARRDAKEGIALARAIIAVGVLATLLAGIGLGIFFAYRISAPAMRLADHAAAIGDGGALIPLPDAAVTDRADEFGKLSRAFNRMIVELAAARQRLIEWSEAEIRTQYERLNAAINNMPQGLCMFDAEQKLIICNKRYSEIYALDPAHAVAGTPLQTVLEDHVAKGTCPQDTEDYVGQRLEAVSGHKPFYYVNEMRDGHVIAISYQPMANGGSVATHEDITERRKAEAKIAYMAHYDALTDLPNRVTFHEEMESALTGVARGEMLAVLCLDLDHFKDVNDTLGHPIGDALLQEVARRIRGCVRPTDKIARLGGDEFAIVQLVADQPVGATTLAERLIAELGKPFDISGHQVVIGASVGIAIAPNDGRDPDQLMKNADMALYRAKEDGRSTHRFFEPDMDAKMQLRRTLELDLRKAVVLGEFEVYYQPTVNLRSKEVTSFEALLRWNHPERGLIMPDEFIPLTEEIGLINQIGAWVLKEACREAMNWPANIGVAVNLSPVQFKGAAVVLDVMAALGVSGLAPQRLELEITETVLLQNTDDTVSTLNRLRDLGVRIAMDDFGTGYSSLGYLRKFPFDKIKIDRSFVHDIADKPNSIAIVRAVSGLGSTLGISTTGEGVETEEQLRMLVDEGCTEVQGFLFSEPKPASELKKVLKRLRPASKAVA